MTATTEKELAQAAAEWEREERPRRACGGALLALPFFFLAVLLLNPSLGEEPADAGDRTVLLHVIPSKDLLLSRPFGEQAPTLSTSREQFAKLFAAQHSAVAFVGPLDAIDAPQDVAPNLRVDGHAAAPAVAASPSPPPTPTRPPPPSPKSPPRSPSPPPAPAPWWIEESLLPPRPKHTAGAAASPLLRNLTLLEEHHDKEWAYEVVDPLPGTLLFARGRAHPCQPYLSDAVVLLVRVCGCDPSIFGVLLSSAPSNETLGASMCPAMRRAAPSFVNHSVHLGGPVGPQWTMLHSSGGVRGAVPLQPGLFAGGCPVEAQRVVNAAQQQQQQQRQMMMQQEPAAAGAGVTARSFAFYSGYQAWPISRLRAEVAGGVWGVAKASSGLILNAVRGKGRLVAADVEAAVRRGVLGGAA